MRKAWLSLGLITLTASAAHAGDVWIGNNVGRIDRHQPLGAGNIFPTLCTQVNAMVAQGTTIFLADSFGSIWKMNTTNLSFEFMPQAFTTTSLAIHNGDLLAGSADGKVRRIRVSDGAVLVTMTVGSTIDAIAVEGDTVYIGGHDTFIRRGSASGPFQVIGACGGQVHSIAVNGNEVLAAALDGKVYRINKSTGQYLGNWFLPAGVDHPKIAMDGAFLVAGGDDGNLVWLNPTTGALVFNTWFDPNITGVAVVSACRADVDRSGALNGGDFAAYLNVYAAGSAHADISGDGRITVNDFMAFLNTFAAGCP